MSNKTAHILAIRFSALGDLAIAVPVFRQFVKQYPQAQLTVLTKKGLSSILRDIPNIGVIEADFNGQHKGVTGLYKLAGSIKKLELTGIADLHNVLRTKLLKLFLFTSKFKQINKGRSEKRALVSGKKFEQLKTTIQRYAEVFDNLGYPLDLSKPEFPERASLNQDVVTLVGTDAKKWIGFAPFAAHDGKMYPLDLTEMVIKKLSFDYKVLLFGGGKKETEILSNLASKYDNVVNIAGRYSLKEELEIISNLDLMISMDSGNAHLAAMQGVEVLTIWGVTHPYAGFYPFNQDLNNALLADRKKFPKIPTSIYGNTHPEGYEDAMRTIPPSAVIDKVKDITSN